MIGGDKNTRTSRFEFMHERIPFVLSHVLILSVRESFVLAVTKTMMLSVVAEASWRFDQGLQLHFFLHINIELLNMFAGVLILLQKNPVSWMEEAGILS